MFPFNNFSRTAVSLAVAVLVAPALAQNTSSSVTGLVTGADGKPVAGAQVVIKHMESGSTATATSGADGRYVARGLRVGGPYTIVISKDGASEKADDIVLPLAETFNHSVTLGKSGAEEIKVTGRSRSSKFSSSSMGATTNISRRDLEAQASIQRNLQDYARADPRLSQSDKERGEISAGGQNSRYNSVTIDGVTINDTFGLEANNMPTAKQPISIDAIQSVQVNISNYDVSQTGYTGANINAVTKSGTNEFHGSAYYVYRDENGAGDRYNRSSDSYTKAPGFDETTTGFTLGGPIIKDKLFFFANYEEMESSRSSPDFGPLGSSLTNVGISPATINAVQELSRSQYGMEIGGWEAPTDTKLKVKDSLLKLDWNINDDHRASFRYTKTEQSEPFYNNFGTRSLSLSSHWYTQEKVIETTVGQWFAKWTPDFSTEFKLSQRDYDSVPNKNSELPAIKLDYAGALPAGSPEGVMGGTRSLNFGTERSRQFNELRTKTLDTYVGANWQLGEHEVKFGMDYTDNDIFNAFLQNVNGDYTFACVNSSATYTYSLGAVNCSRDSAERVAAAVLENYRIGRPSSYQVQAPLAGRTRADGAAKFTVQNTGVFAQDTWKIDRNLSLMYGLRLDRQGLPDTPLANAEVAKPMVAGNVVGNVRQTGGFGVDNTYTMDGEVLVQPRVGFNLKIDSARSTQLRGGFGLFQGAAANVWMGNPYANSGMATQIVGCGISGFAACPTTGGVFSADPNNQRTNFTGAVPAVNVDLIEDGLTQPSVWKANLAFDHELPWGGLVLGAEWVYTNTRTGIYYRNLNLGAPTATGKDGRELYYNAQGYNPNCWRDDGSSNTSATGCNGLRAKALSNEKFNNVLMASSTSKGSGNATTLSLSQPARGGLGWSLAFTRTSATEVSPLNSSTSGSNFAGRSIFNPNEEVAANSAYLTRDRVNASLNWERSLFGGLKTSVGLFYEGRKGKPYSWTFKNDLNGDGLAGNDLMYIPSRPGSGEVVFLGDTATSHTNEERFWEVVNQHQELRNSAGKATRRNGSFSPFVNSFDIRIKQELFAFSKHHKASLTLDFLNVANMLNKRWGHIDEVGFQTNGGQARSFVNYVGMDAQGRYVYAMDSVENLVTRQSKGESQWAVQGTLRYEF
ncbi:TonB-dependent receptor [Chitinimonas sp. JJ19]|uniref:TonB-dependent receptor n=1 Tax=Chitinimonas sp. JJ19 TaxID=3109352 RepID=UPI002FFE7D91